MIDFGGGISEFCGARNGSFDPAIRVAKHLGGDPSQHELIACIVPRACCYLTNSNGTNDWCHFGSTPEALGVGKNLTFQMPEGGAHGHCGMMGGGPMPDKYYDVAQKYYEHFVQGDESVEVDGEMKYTSLQEPVDDWKEHWVDWNMDVTLE